MLYWFEPRARSPLVPQDVEILLPLSGYWVFLVLPVLGISLGDEPLVQSVQPPGEFW
jgi:hypothetical protein